LKSQKIFNFLSW